MDDPTGVAELRARLEDLEARLAEMSRKLGPQPDLETMRFELAEVAWHLDELAGHTR